MECKDWELGREKGTLREEVEENANQAYDVEYWISILNSYTNLINVLVFMKFYLIF